ncbi:TM0106 family RecB-like putative nuclease, partial [Candidatus Parcubacteria bacterium]
MKNIVTEQTFYKYLKCPHWLVYDRDKGTDLRDALLEKLQDDGLLPEKEYELIKDKEVSVVDLEDIDEAAQKTIELMRQGASTIYKGVLAYENWVGHPDLLERVEGKSEFGNWYYVACDIKRSQHLKMEYRYQGAFYAMILEKIQGVRPVQGYIMRSDGKVESFLLSEVLPDFHLALDEIEDILAGHNPEHFLTSACKQSPWFHACRRLTEEQGDLSLINRIWRSEIKALRAAGITTVEELASISEKKLEEVSGISRDRLQFLHLQALALTENKIIRLADIQWPDNNYAKLIIDVESDPLRDIDYLIGVL